MVITTTSKYNLVCGFRGVSEAYDSRLSCLSVHTSQFVQSVFRVGNEFFEMASKKRKKHVRQPLSGLFLPFCTNQQCQIDNVLARAGMLAENFQKCLIRFLFFAFARMVPLRGSHSHYGFVYIRAINWVWTCFFALLMYATLTWLYCNQCCTFCSQISRFTCILCLCCLEDCHIKTTLRFLHKLFSILFSQPWFTHVVRQSPVKGCHWAADVCLFCQLTQLFNTGCIPSE